MKLRLLDPERVDDLLRFLRVNGCIAYGVDDPLTLEVIRAYAFGDQEVAEIRDLVDRWQLSNPTARVEFGN